MEHNWDLFVLGVKLPTVRAQVLLSSRRYQLPSKKISHIWDTYRFCRASDFFFSPVTNFLTLGISFDPPFSYFLRKLNLKNVAIFLKFKKKSCSWGFAIFLSTECPCMEFLRSEHGLQLIKDGLDYAEESLVERRLGGAVDIGCKMIGLVSVKELTALLPILGCQ